MTKVAVTMDATSLNMKAIKRIDSTATSIINSASRAAVYDYDKNASGYKNCQVTGSLFIYQRNETPHQAVMLMNVKNNENVILKITKGVEVRLYIEHQVILWKGEQARVLKCLWFHDIEELKKIGDQISQIIEMEKLHDIVGSAPTQKQQVEAEKNKKNNNTVDIMKMLSQAKREQQVANNNTSSSIMTSPPFNPLSGAISVVDLENPLRNNLKSEDAAAVKLHNTNTAFSKLLPKLKQQENHQQLPPLTHVMPPSGSCSSSPDSIIIDHPHNNGSQQSAIDLANNLKKLLIKPTPSIPTTSSMKTNSAFKQITKPASTQHATTQQTSTLLSAATADIRSRMSIPHPAPIVVTNKNPTDASIQQQQQQQKSMVLMSPEDFMPKQEQQHNNNDVEQVGWLASYMSHTALHDPLFPHDENKFTEVMINLLKYDPEFRSRLHESYMQQYHQQEQPIISPTTPSVIHNNNSNNNGFVHQQQQYQYRDDNF